MQISCEVSLQK